MNLLRSRSTASLLGNLTETGQPHRRPRQPGSALTLADRALTAPAKALTLSVGGRSHCRHRRSQSTLHRFEWSLTPTTAGVSALVSWSDRQTTVLSSSRYRISDAGSRTKTGRAGTCVAGLSPP